MSAFQKTIQEAIESRPRFKVGDRFADGNGEIQVLASGPAIGHYHVHRIDQEENSTTWASFVMSEDELAKCTKLPW